MMLRKNPKERAEKANTEDEASKNTGPTPNEKLRAQTFDEYQCSGNVEIDFPQLCALLDIKNIPAVSTRQQSSSNTETSIGVIRSQNDASWSKPCLQVELENNDPLSAKCLKIAGWKMGEQITQVLQKMLPSLSKLQSLRFWQAGLTDSTVTSLLNTISVCTNLRIVALEGNPLPEKSYHLLLAEDSVLNQLSLRNNRMGDEGARLIGLALSTTRSANKNLISLNLSFNSIGDAGAKHIAQGLRLNRALLFLSLSNNQIGDAGAAHLAATLGEFALTHEEVAERRKLLLEQTQSYLQSSSVVESDQSPADQLPSVPSNSSLSSNKGKKKEASKKGEKPVATKENPKTNKKSSDVKVPQSKGSKRVSKEKQATALEEKSSTSLVEEKSSTSLVEEKSSTSLVEEKSSTSLVEEKSSTSLVEEKSSTSLVEEKSSTSLVEEKSSTSLVEEKSSTSLVEEKSSTSLVEEKSSTSLVEEKSSTSLVEEKSSTSLVEQTEKSENPLLDQSVKCRDGELFLPGNRTLLSLNLSGNRITEKSLPLFLNLMQIPSEAEKKGLLRLCLQRNNFPSDCESYVKIQELVKLADPLKKMQL